jgi:hypothetical protein
MSILFRCLITVLFLLPIPLLSQTATPLPQTALAKPSAPALSKTVPVAPPRSPEAVGPSTPVIILAGICDKAASSSSSCKTTVTREQFERLAQVVQPGIDAAGRQRLAALYSQLLVFANAAQQRGLDKTADAQESLHFAQLQALSQVLARKVQGEASEVSSDDVQKYYHEHPQQFEEASLLRLYVPRNREGEGKPVKEEDAQAEIKKLRDRAVHGERFESLQKQAYADLGIVGNTPPIELKRVRREGLTSATAAVFDLQLATLSQPISEPNGLYVFEMTSKRVVPLQEATPEIMTKLQNQRLQQALGEISASTKVTFNGGYFGDAVKAASADFGPVPGQPALRDSANSSTVPVNSQPSPSSK